MDERLLRLYEQELQFLREGAAEFAKAYPKVASHIGLDTQHSHDPSVERLLEGLGFLTARIQLQMESEFPQFTRNLLEQVQPQSLMPLPSMAVVQFTPDKHQGSLLNGYCLPASTALSAMAELDGRTVRCDWRSTQPVTLWPVQIESADYLASASLLSDLPGQFAGQAYSALRLRLRTTTKVTFKQLALEELCLYLGGAGTQALAVHEALLSRAVGVLARSSEAAPTWSEFIEPGCITQANLERAADTHEPVRGASGHAGFALLRRFLAFPEGQRFINLSGLGPAVRRCDHDGLELLIVLAPLSNPLPLGLDRSYFSLFCAPVENLFRKRTDRINLLQHKPEIPLLVDQANPLNHEVHQVLEVHGYFSGSRERQRFVPLYSPQARLADAAGSGFFQVHRAPSRPRATALGGRQPYVGSDLSISVVDPQHPPHRPDLHQLAAEVLCSNRDVPMHIGFGKGNTDFVLDASAPVLAIRRVAGPSTPLSVPVSGEGPWRAIQHLSRNYLPLANDDGHAGAQGLRELLSLYIAADDAVLQRLLDGIVSLRTTVLTQRLPGKGPVAFGRGLQLHLTLDDAACEGIGAFAFGAVLDVFFARYAAINAFTQTVLYTVGRGMIMRWPVRSSQCMTL
uniref:type VI secretion system baseplate subunit TssF n=1 Tax=Pseudomonas laurentiana TaxID=2364649 RepID=UPI0029C6A0A5|nr:type VI secretion system baseplate subunit TssF [Pseudomonas laurentiana]